MKKLLLFLIVISLSLPNNAKALNTIPNLKLFKKATKVDKNKTSNSLSKKQNATTGGDSFNTTWETTSANESITIPTTGTGYNYDVDWGDGTHSYATAGTYTIAITGTFPRIHFNNNNNSNKIKTIAQWGTNAWTSMNNAFYGCTNLTINATDAPNLSNVSDMSYMFFRATGFSGDLSTWNVSQVTYMGSMFSYATAFNGDISAWDVSNVTDMSYMFSGATAFNQNLGTWDISNVTNMSGMFAGVTLTTINYDNTLIGWSTLITVETRIPRDITLDAPNCKYSQEAARNTLINSYGWIINDAGLDTSLGIDENIIKGFAMYPNPVKDILTISAKVYIKQIQIFNLLGQQVVQKNVNDNKVLLDVSGLIQSTYFAIVTTDKTRKSVKFLKE